MSGLGALRSTLNPKQAYGFGSRDIWAASDARGKAQHGLR